MKRLTISAPLILALIAALPGAAQAEMHVLATFGNRGGSVVGFASGAVQQTRLAGIILGHPQPPSDTNHEDVPARIVVVFDKQTWPQFEAMWKACLMAVQTNTQCGEPPVHDSADGTQVSLSVATASNRQPDWRGFPRSSSSGGPSVWIELMDKDGNHGGVGISVGDERSLRQVKEAIRKISDYLNQ